MEWMPIEAYKGKKPGQFVAFYFPAIQSSRMTLPEMVNGEGQTYGRRQATHFCPLPPPPTGDK